VQRFISSPAIFLVIMLALPASADIIRVPTDQPTIQAGIDAAVSGDTVLVADGTYTGDGNREITFNGKAITVTSENGPENCLIDVYPDHVRVFVFDSGESPESVLKGFTISGGRGEIGESEWGGGIYCEGSSPTIRDNIITGNTSCFGAGICCWTGSGPLIEGNVITGNQMQYSLDTGSYGGGIFVYQCDLIVIRGNVISWNIADLWSMGCAMYGQESTVELANNLVVHNGVGKEPFDALRFNECEVLIRNLTLADNEISHFGAINLGDCTGVIKNSIIRNDFETQVYLHESDCTMRYCDVQDGWPGEGNIDADPLFVSGLEGDYYLSQVAAGQVADSPCVDAGQLPAVEECWQTVKGPVCLDDLATRTDEINDQGIADMGFHYPASKPVAAWLTCEPDTGTVPFTTRLSIGIENLLADEFRQAAGRIDVVLGNGTAYPNWRAGHLVFDPGESFAAAWRQGIPAVTGVIGSNTFTFTVADVTPPPYNQPPYSPSGSTELASCTVTAVAP